MNRQDAFNKVWDWAVVKNNPKSGNSNYCYYRGPGNNRCFVGVLIPDSMYSPDMESTSASDMISKYPVLMDYFSIDTNPSDLGFLENLQEIHDYYDTGLWQEELSKFATKYNLQIPS